MQWNIGREWERERGMREREKERGRERIVSASTDLYTRCSACADRVTLVTDTYTTRPSCAVCWLCPIITFRRWIIIIESRDGWRGLHWFNARSLLPFRIETNTMPPLRRPAILARGHYCRAVSELVEIYTLPGSKKRWNLTEFVFFKREYLNAIIRFDKLGVINFPILYCYALYKIYPPFYFFIIQYAVANESENFEVSYGYAWRRIVCVAGYCVFFQK